MAETTNQAEQPQKHSNFRSGIIPRWEKKDYVQIH